MVVKSFYFSAEWNSGTFNKRFSFSRYELYNITTRIFWLSS